MTGAERDNLFNLYIHARNAWGHAERTKTVAAYAADKSFTDALYSIEVTE